MAKQSNPGPVDELRRVRVPDDVRWKPHLDMRADGGRGVLHLRGYTKDQRNGAGEPRIDVSMSPVAAIGLSRFLTRSGEFDEVRPGPPPRMPRLEGQRRVDVGNGDVELRWAGGFDGDRIRLDAVDAATAEIRLALEVPERQAALLEVMLRVLITGAGGPEFSGMPR
jgi:hypothetical protein